MSCLLVPTIPSRAPGMWWAFNEYLLSELMDANGESDLGKTNDHAKDNKVIKWLSWCYDLGHLIHFSKAPVGRLMYSVSLQNTPDAKHADFIFFLELFPPSGIGLY